MPLINIEKDDEKIKPCICGKDKRTTLYATPELSPNKTDVSLGLLVMAVIEIGVPVFFFYNGISVLTPFVVIPIPLTMSGLALSRRLKGHKTLCSIRWAYFVVLGTARFLTF